MVRLGGETKSLFAAERVFFRIDHGCRIDAVRRKKLLRSAAARSARAVISPIDSLGHRVL
jgi:hypothetical protein